MKRNKLFFVILTVLAIVCVFVACNKDAQYTLGKKDGMSFTLAVGADDVDFTQYFSITNKQGDSIAVTEDMLDLSQVDTSKPGTFNVGLSYKGYHFTATFTVQSQNVNGADLSAVFNKYNSYEKWNFEVDYKVDVANIPQWDYVYGFMGDNFSMSYDYDGQTFTDYIEYVASTGKLVYYADLGDGTHDVINEDDDAFDQYYMYVDYLELCNLNNFAFEDKGAYYSAMDIQAVGNEILGEYQDNTWTQVDLYIQNGEIVKIIASADALDDSNNAVEYVYTIVFSNHGNVEFDLSALKINQGGGDDDGGDDVKADYSTTFISAALGVGSGELEYTSNVGANSLDANRGLQFMQANGEAVLTSKLELTGVTQVSVIVATNQDLGMLVSVCVGGVQMTSGGQTSVKVGKSASFTEMTTLTFVSSAPLNGSVEITLTNTATKKSMYIKTITVSCGSTGGEVSRPVMEKQIYDAATFDRSNLQDRIEKLGDAIGLPSTGTYDCLVVPVQFAGTTISQNDLARLDNALNGTQADTGWESVKTYYQKSSYGQLNMSFDIQDVYVSQNNATYYKNYTDSTDENVDGSTLILTEVLTYLEPLIDLNKYDSNNDGVIDAVYLIYSAPVDYQNADFYWAYVTWYLGEQKFDGLDAYYYLFAGFDFMNESTGSNDNSGASQIDGLSINASTYIHETGHLLGLDDYYDYDENSGSGEGLGGADMMDATVGDQNAYSKLMLGWVEPAQIVTETATVTINSFVDSGQFILIPLSFDNTYFCEYLIIDLYSATGLNALHAAQSNSYLYDGISCGVRIYHVSTELINNLDDYDGNSYWSYTKYNNSDSQHSLIKLVEADGDKKFSSTNGWAADQDLWQTGDTLSSIQPNYTRNDGKLLNFDITINSVSATSATITITYSAEE